MLRILANGNYAIVAAVTSADHLSMVYRISRDPYGRVVAILANDGRINVRWVLASCVSAIVAVRAIARDVHMIEVRR